MCYVDGVGLVMLISTQSRDGSFAASKTDYPVDVLTLVGDSDLGIMWHVTFDESIDRIWVSDGLISLSL